jgi:hypothetical protein
MRGEHLPLTFLTRYRKKFRVFLGKAHIALVCGLPACCNWMHLQEQRPSATQAVYLRSARVVRRRWPLKVTPALADRIRQAWHEQQPITQRHFAAQWGLSQTTVSQILREERHKPTPAAGL